MNYLKLRVFLMILSIYTIFGLMYSMSEMYWTGKNNISKKRILLWWWYLIKGLFGYD